MAFGPMVNWNSHLLQLLGPDWKSTHRNVGSNKFLCTPTYTIHSTPHTHGDQISVPAPVTSQTTGIKVPYEFSYQRATQPQPLIRDSYGFSTYRTILLFHCPNHMVTDPTFGQHLSLLGIYIHIRWSYT